MFSSNTTQVSSDAAYIEDVFSTWLYAGNDSTQTIANGIDLAGKGGLVWFKFRSGSYGAANHQLYDTARGVQKKLATNTAGAEATEVTGLTSFNSNGFTFGGDGNINGSGQNYVSWTFREQPKFFDVVTYTGNGANRTIAHNLGSVPGCIIVKSTSAAEWWAVQHISLGPTQTIYLNSTGAAQISPTNWNDTAPTSTEFTVGTNTPTNAAGQTYVAYLFAHNAGGFGATGADNVISCGSFTTDADGFATVNLGYEPQWVLMKRTDSTGSWTIFDNMRGWSSSQAQLFPNNSNAEGVGGPLEILRATGFATKAFSFASNATNIYIAIRRGPMRTPTSGTSVFNTILQTPQSAGTLRTVGFPADWMIGTYTAAATPRLVNTRLTGFANNSGSSQNTPGLQTQSTNAEANEYPLFFNVWNTTARDGDYIFGSNGVNWLFRRAPGFFDVVCYTGTGVARTVNHNLGVAPELMIVKSRSDASNWRVYHASLGATMFITLDTDFSAFSNSTLWNNTPPTNSVFTVGTAGSVNQSASTFIAYLFASCPGVSKVGSYTGTGSTQTINCGFSAGARFVLIKRTDSTGDWYVWDSARGIVAGNDPYLLLNSTAAEVTNTDWVDTAASGFELSNAGGNLVNINGASYIFLSVA